MLAQLDFEVIVALVNALLTQIDINALVSRLDMDQILDKVDLNALLQRVDVEALVERTELGAIITKARPGWPERPWTPPAARASVWMASCTAGWTGCSGARWISPTDRRTTLPDVVEARAT